MSDVSPDADLHYGHLTQGQCARVRRAVENGDEGEADRQAKFYGVDRMYIDRVLAKSKPRPERVRVQSTSPVPARLRELRVSAELSQWDLAKLLNTGQNRISDWETGIHEPTLPILKRLADVYAMTVSELLEGVM